MRALADTNIALDLIMAREPFVLDAMNVFSLAEAGRIELLLTTDALSTIFYVVEENRDAATARTAIETLLDFVELAWLDDRAVRRGLALDFTDIEDAFVASVAEKAQADAIVTRNGKDFASSPVTVMDPREFLAFWASLESGPTSN